MDERSGLDPDIPAERSLDEIFRILQSPNRRFALYHLKERETPRISRQELARKIQERQLMTGVDEILDERELDVRLHQVDLPLMEDAGIVSYDDAEDLVTYEGDPDIEWFVDDRTFNYERRHHYSEPGAGQQPEDL